MLTVRVVAGRTAEDDDAMLGSEPTRLRVQVFVDNPVACYRWRTLAYYSLEERERALACAREIEQMPTAPRVYFGGQQPDCILYLTGVKDAVPDAVR